MNIQKPLKEHEPLNIQKALKKIANALRGVGVPNQPYYPEKPKDKVLRKRRNKRKRAKNARRRNRR